MATYYISNAGNDLWDGSTPSYVGGTTGPWATTVNFGSVLPGDTISFRNGDTFSFFNALSGTAGNNITYTNYNAGSSTLPVFKNTNFLTSFVSVAAPNVPNIFSETFQAVGGYDNASFWTTTGTVNTSVLTSGITTYPNPLGWGTKCFSTSGSQNYISGTINTPNNISYLRLEVIPTAITALYEYSDIVFLNCSGSGSKECVYISMQKTDFNMRFVFSFCTDGGSSITQFATSSDIPLNEKYLLELKYDVTNLAAEAKVNGISLGTTPLTLGVVPISVIALGSDVTNSFVGTQSLYFDNLGISSTGYIGWSSQLWKATLSGSFPIHIARDVSTNAYLTNCKSASNQVGDVQDFYHDTTNNFLYIAKATQPTNIEVPITEVGMIISGTNGGSYVVYNNLNFQMADQYIFELAGGTNCTIKNCIIQGAHGAGILITPYTTGYNNNLIINNNNISYIGGSGIQMGSNNCVNGLTITKNNIFNTCVDKNTGQDDLNYSAAIRLYGPTGNSNIIISYNNCYNNGTTFIFGSNANAGFGMWIDTLCNNSAQIYGNKCYNNTQIGIHIEMCQGHNVYSNVIYNNGYHGLSLSRGAKSHNIAHNTVYNNGHKQLSLNGINGIGPEGLDQDVSGNAIVNNIFICGLLSQIAMEIDYEFASAASANTFTNNCFGSEFSNMFFYTHSGQSEVPYSTYASLSSAIAANTGTSPTFLNGTPSFNNIGAGDLSLAHGSFGIHATAYSPIPINGDVNGYPFLNPSTIGAYSSPNPSTRRGRRR